MQMFGCTLCACVRVKEGPKVSWSTYFIPSLNLELGRQPANPSDPPVSTPHSAAITTLSSHIWLSIGSGEANSSLLACIASKLSYLLIQLQFQDIVSFSRMTESKEWMDLPESPSFLSALCSFDCQLLQWPYFHCWYQGKRPWASLCLSHIPEHWRNIWEVI